MPRPLNVGRYGLESFTTPIPTTIPTQITFLQPPAGMNTQLRNNQFDRGLMKLVENLHIRDGHYRLRDGTTTIGGLSGTELIYACQYELPSGKRWTLRWSTNAVQYYRNGLWNNCSGVTVNANVTSNLALTGWGSTLLFSTQVGKIYQIDFDTGTPTVSELSPDAPGEVIHLTSFAGRVIASVRNFGMQWTIRNDSTDWVGLGSGFETLQSAPGGQVDQQVAVIPVTDEYAYAIRSNSVWQMTQTGDFDAPFAFSRVYGNLGTPYPGTVTDCRQGVVFLSRDNVVFISPTEGLVEIGMGIRESLRVAPQYLRHAAGAFDVRNNEYRLSVPDENSLNAHKVYRYSFATRAWVVDVYPFPVRSVAFTRYSQGITIGQLVGTIGDLAGTIGNLGGGDTTVGAIYATSGQAKRVIRDSSDVNNNPERDVNSNGTPINSGFRIESGYIIKDRTTEKITITEQQFEYESDDELELLFEYSTDGGTTWEQYSTVSLPATTGVRIASVRQTLERDNLCLALSTDQSPNFRIVAWHVWAINGAKVEDAR